MVKDIGIPEGGDARTIRGSAGARRYAAGAPDEGQSPDPAVRGEAGPEGRGRRDSERVTVANSWIEYAGERHLIRNISASGILAQPYRGLAHVGEFVRMAVHIDDAGLEFSFNAEATVVRIERDAIAFKFFAFAPGGKDMLARYFTVRFGSKLFNLEA